MNIWEKCKQYDALPYWYYGFPVIPVIPEIQGRNLIFNFPEGYAPDGSKTDKVANELLELVGKKIILQTETVIAVELDYDKLAYILYKCMIHEQC